MNPKDALKEYWGHPKGALRVGGILISGAKKKPFFKQNTFGKENFIIEDSGE